MNLVSFNENIEDSRRGRAGAVLNANRREDIERRNGRRGNQLKSRSRSAPTSSTAHTVSRAVGGSVEF